MCFSLLGGCQSKERTDNFGYYAEVLMDSTLKYYKADKEGLFYDIYPKNDNDLVTCLCGDTTVLKSRVAYLWSMSGTLSSVISLLELTGEQKYESLLNYFTRTIMRCYYDTLRTPYAYQSYISCAGKSDRFYDDNLWLGIDFIECYKLTGNSDYLYSAKKIWDFIESGRDSVLGGGIYWCEQSRSSKNTCSNAPAVVLALKLYKETGNVKYFDAGKDIYEWVRENLRDSSDNIYFDNITLDGSINKTKFQYNSGQMLQAATLLYKATGNKKYLEDAYTLAEACNSYFFKDYTSKDEEKFRVLKNGNMWFIAVMLRGFEELYDIDKNPFYIENFRKTLQCAWDENTNSNKLFDDDLFIEKLHNPKNSKWLLTQVAMIEMYSRLANIK